LTSGRSEGGGCMRRLPTAVASPATRRAGQGTAR
jgi:hypothetical protein